MKATIKTALFLFLLSFLLNSCAVTHSVMTEDHYNVGKLTVLDACDKNGAVNAWMYNDLDGSFEITFPSGILRETDKCYIINDSINKSVSDSKIYTAKTCNNISGTIYNPAKSDCFIDNSAFNGSPFEYICVNKGTKTNVRFKRTNGFPFKYAVLPFAVIADVITFPVQFWLYHKASKDLGNGVYDGFFGMWSNDNGKNLVCVPLPQITKLQSNMGVVTVAAQTAAPHTP